MGKAVAPARPKKLAGAEASLSCRSFSGLSRLGGDQAKVVVHVDPGIVFVVEHELGSAGSSIDEVKLYLILCAIQYLSIGDAVVHPAEAREVNICLGADRSGRRRRVFHLL